MSAIEYVREPQNDSTEVHICFRCSDAYAIYAPTSVYSILANNQNSFVYIYFLTDGISDERWAKIIAVLLAELVSHLESIGWDPLLCIFLLRHMHVFWQPHRIAAAIFNECSKLSILFCAFKHLEELLVVFSKLLRLYTEGSGVKSVRALFSTSQMLKFIPLELFVDLIKVLLFLSQILL